VLFEPGGDFQGGEGAEVAADVDHFRFDAVVFCVAEDFGVFLLARVIWWPLSVSPFAAFTIHFSPPPNLFFPMEFMK